MPKLGRSSTLFFKVFWDLPNYYHSKNSAINVRRHISIEELTWLHFGVLISLDGPHFGAKQAAGECIVSSLWWPRPRLCSGKPFTRTLARREQFGKATGSSRLELQTQEIVGQCFVLFRILRTKIFTWHMSVEKLKHSPQLPYSSSH